MFYIIFFVSVVIPWAIAIGYAYEVREYKTRLDQVCHSYHAVSRNLSEGKSYNYAMESLMEDLNVVLYH